MDAKFGFDDNAEFRQKDIFALRDLSQEDQGEVDAAKYGLNFISEFESPFLFPCSQRVAVGRYGAERQETIE